MNQKKANHTTGELQKFFRYVSFNVVSMLGLSLYVLADTYFVANGVGSDGLAALNQVLPAYSLLNGLGLMLGMGGATHYSIARAENNSRDAARTFTYSMVCAAFLGVLITIMGVLFSEELAILLQASEQTAAMAALYIRTILSFSLAFLCNNILICFVRNDGAPQLAMAAMLTASLSNIFLDYLFVYPLQMGIFGAAFATGCSPVISMMVLSIHFIKKSNHIRLAKISWSFQEMKQIVTTGLPSLITEFSSGVVILVFNSIILMLADTTGVAAYGIIANIALVCLALFNGIGQGIQPLVSAQYGAGEKEKMKHTYRNAILVAVVMGCILFLIGLCFPQALTAAFNQENNLELAALAEHGIVIYFTAFPFMGINMVSTIFLACAGSPKSAFWGSILRGFILVLPLVIILPMMMGIDGVWSSVPVAELLTCIVNIIFIYYYHKKMKDQLN